MDKLYCLTSGEYSDYGIVGIFSSLKKIEEYKDYAKRVKIEYYRHLYPEDSEEDLLDHIYDLNFNTPFEIKIDVLIENKDLLPFRVYMMKNGDVVDIYPDESINEEDNWYLNKHNNPNNSWDIQFYLKGKDKEHAIKIANERRVQLIANNEL